MLQNSIPFICISHSENNWRASYTFFNIGAALHDLLQAPVHAANRGIYSLVGLAIASNPAR